MIHSSSNKPPTGIVNGNSVYSTQFEDNHFPYQSVYPKALADLITELQHKSGFPADFSACSMLMAFATALGASTQLRFKDNFLVFGNLYCILVGEAGCCKSHPISYSFKPIREKQAIYYKEYKEKMKSFKLLESMCKQQKVSVPESEKPKLNAITLDNFTLETLLLRLSENPKGLSLVVDEVNSLFENMNRYNTGSDAETYNSLWSGLPIRVDRKTTDSYYIPPTAVSIFGTIQPGILENVFSKGKDISGFSARFLWVIPDNLQLNKWTFENVNEELYNQYSKAINKLLDIEFQKDQNGEPIPNIIKFTEEAFNRMVTWHNGDEFYEKIIEDKGKTFYDAFVKLDNYALRFALILQMIYASVENENPNEVGIRAVENAILLVNYFMREAIKAHKIVYGKDIRLQMSEKQREVYNLLNPDVYIVPAYEQVAKVGFTKDQLKKFLGTPKFFKRISRGHYRKVFIEVLDD